MSKIEAKIEVAFREAALYEGVYLQTRLFAVDHRTWLG